MLRTSSTVLAIFCNVMLHGVARSEGFDSPLIVYKFQQISDMIISRYLKNAQKSDKDIIISIKVKVDGLDNNVYGVRAQLIDGRREIIIPIGFIAAIYDVNIAMADKLTFDAGGPIATADLSNYIEYVSEALKASNIAVRTEGTITGIMNFCVFRKLPDKECAKRSIDPDFLKVISRVEYSALTFIIGHEIGHHVLGHLGNDKPLFLNEKDTVSQQMETAADIYSTKAMVRSDLLVDGAMATMFLFSYLKGQAALSGVSGDHPHPLCRWIRILEVEQEELPNNKTLVQLFNDKGLTLEDNRAALDALRATATQCQP